MKWRIMLIPESVPHPPRTAQFFISDSGSSNIKTITNDWGSYSYYVWAWSLAKFVGTKIAFVAGAKRGGIGGGKKRTTPLPFPLSPYPLPLSTPATQARTKRKMSPKELPGYLVPHLLIAYTRQLEILQPSNITYSLHKIFSDCLVICCAWLSKDPKRLGD